MFGATAPLLSRSTTTPRRQLDDDYYGGGTSGGRRNRGSSSASVASYRTRKDWQTINPDQRADYKHHDRAGYLRDASSSSLANVLAEDYVDVWEEYGDTYDTHLPYHKEWQNALQQRNLHLSLSSSISSNQKALEQPVTNANNSTQNLNETNANDSLDDCCSNPSDESSYCPSSPETQEDEDYSDSSVTLDSSVEQSFTKPTTPYNTRLKDKQKTQNTALPKGSKNARRKRERMLTRLQEKNMHAQQNLKDAERELLQRTTDDSNTVSPALSSSTSSTSNVAKMPQNFTTDQFFDALEAAIQHAQNSSVSASNQQQRPSAKPSTRDNEKTPDVPVTEYMRQICGSTMNSIDQLVAYRMIMTVDYIRYVHQYWQSRMHIPDPFRPRMPLSVAANYLRNDCLYIDSCRVLDTTGTHRGNNDGWATQILIQFDCKFNNMCAEDQEEADRKREPFRPFNEVELRADVDEFCTAISTWICDDATHEQCNNNMLMEDPKAFEKSPMGDITVHWDTFVFGFRTYAITRV